MKVHPSLPLLLACACSPALAKAPADQVAQLGESLTPMGAVLQGNASGTIPAWTGGLAETAGQRDENGFLSDPFAAEQPLYVIRADNMAEYDEQLTEAHKAMLMRYPDTYRVPVYPTHRTFSAPEFVYEAARYNAAHTELVSEGNGLSDFKTATPFPLASGPLEVVWNHITRYRGGSVKRESLQATPLADGRYTPVRFVQQFTFFDQLTDYSAETADNILFYYKSSITSPARLAGNVTLVHETIDQVAEPRKAWIYNAGQRRVRRAPQVAYDGPYPASDGMRTADNLDMFNGAPDRYNWTLVGKTEKLLPMNAFRLQSPELEYDDIIQAGHLNQGHTRYELRRVWVVEADLKAGQRNVYSKRRFYVDEDSWQIGVSEHFDERGTLWRVGEGHQQMDYDRKVAVQSTETLYDLLNGRYIVSGLVNEEKQPFDFDYKASSADYTPASLRTSGVR